MKGLLTCIILNEFCGKAKSFCYIRANYETGHSSDLFLDLRVLKVARSQPATVMTFGINS